MEGVTGSRLRAGIVSALLALSCATAVAQTTGTIYGEISDPTAAAISNANVTVQNTATGLTRKAVSNAVGSYLVPALPPGPYKVTVEHPGFRSYAQSGVTVTVGENARVDAKLEVGAVAQTMEVSGSAVSVDTSSTTIGTTVDNLRLQTMPLNGRNVLGLTQMLPGFGTAPLNTQVINARAGPRINVSGSRSTENMIMLDGTPMLDQMTNSGINLPSPDALQEFRVLTNTYSAEYGRASGGVFLAVTKSGTNNFHGSLFEYLRNDDLNARNFFALTKPFLRQNQFGGSIGGPVRLPHYNGRDRTFFFFTYQGLRIRQQNLLASFPATAAERAGDFSTSSKPVIDPTTGSPFPGNRIPTSRFDPLAVGILNQYIPLPNLPSGEDLALLSQPTTSNEYTAKVDQQFSESSRLSVRFYRNLGTLGNTYEGSNVAGPGLLGGNSNLVQTENLKYIKIFSPSLLNDASFSHLRDNYDRQEGPGDKTPKELGGDFNNDGPQPLTPQVSVTGRFTLQPEFPSQEPEDTFTLTDKLTWMRGRHSLSFGGYAEQDRHLTRAEYESAGSFAFSGAFTGNAMADYLIGRPLSDSSESLIDDTSRSGNYQFFAQDDFKVNSRLTLNVGLRYELFTPWVQVHDHTANILPGDQSVKFSTAPPGLVFPGDPGVPQGLIPAEKDDFRPRIGLAWDPTGSGRTAIRAAYGLFGNYVGAIMSSVNNQTEPYLVPISLNAPPSFSDPYNVSHGGKDPFPYVINQSNPTFIYPMQGYMLNPHFRNAYVEQWNLNVQHQFTSSVFVQAGYFGNEGHHLSDTREVNQAVFGPGATEANAQSRRPYFPQYFGSIVETDSYGNSVYHALQVLVNKKFSHAYTLEVAYTFSKSIDEGSNSQADRVTPQNGNNYLEGERGLSDLDQSNVLAINGVWQLPFMKGNRFLGGWELAAITRITSGLPFSILSGCDCALAGSGGGSQRANVTGNWQLNPDRPRGQLVAEYFNTSAFALPASGQFGNSGRNIVTGPGYSDTDLSLQKKFYLPGEARDIEFRADVFNLLNQVNFATPTIYGVTGLGNTFGSPAFGKLLAAQDGRIVQLVLRFDF